MALRLQVVVDCADPAALGRFWALALGYVEEPPPPGFPTLDAALDAVGITGDDRTKAYAVVDPDGDGPRLFFQRVPEGKQVKNRLHLDVRAGGPRGAQRWEQVLEARDRLVAAGASVLREVEEPPEHFLVLADPEGNELCLV